MTSKAYPTSLTLKVFETTLFISGPNLVDFGWVIVAQ